MIKTRYIAAVIGAAALTLSTVASAGGFATWPSVGHAGRSFAYWGGRHGAHWGRWQPGAAGYWYPGKYSSGARVYYGCPGCGGGGYYYDDDHHHGNDNALWYGLGVATPLLLQGLQNHDRDYYHDY